MLENKTSSSVVIIFLVTVFQEHLFYRRFLNACWYYLSDTVSLLDYFSSLMQWKISQTLARNLCAIGCSICWSHGVLYCPVNSQRFWTRDLAASQVSMLSGVIRVAPLNLTPWFYIIGIAYGGFFLHCLFLYRNIANSLPNVALPKVPSLPLNLPQIPNLSTPSWMTSLYESTCVFLTYFLVMC